MFSPVRGPGACAEVDSDTEAVAGVGFKLGCISCKRRTEVVATATVEWYFRSKEESDFSHIYSYNENGATVESDNFMDRVDWNGSKRSNDIQDASIYLLNVTFNDSGTYQCFFHRILTYDNYEYSTIISKVVTLTVVAKATRGTASIVSEFMMYFTVIGLQVWLLIEMIYCYRKISAHGEEALREAALLPWTEHIHPPTDLHVDISGRKLLFISSLYFTFSSPKITHGYDITESMSWSGYGGRLSWYFLSMPGGTKRPPRKWYRPLNMEADFLGAVREMSMSGCSPSALPCSTSQPVGNNK
ncbi:hypothetical protein F7725_025502, partial [Dissostichus mawsoni]